MIYPVTVYGDPVLREKTNKIGEDFEGLSELVASMFETMAYANGVGLAAPQIGKPLRLFVVNATSYADEEPQLKDFKKAFINPEITEVSDDTCLMNEGCLSIPEIHEDIKRPSSIRIKYQDENLKWHEESYDGFAARVIQHEYDHLEGKLLIDYISPLKKRLLKSKLSSISSGKLKPDYKTTVPGKRQLA